MENVQFLASGSLARLDLRNQYVQEFISGAIH